MKKTTAKKPKAKKEVKPKPEGYVFGRPTSYTQELADRICKKIATTTMGTKRLCATYDWMPSHDTIYEWIFDHKYFSDQYAAAKRAQGQLLAEETVDIADDASNDIRLSQTGDEVVNAEFVARSKLRVDTRKWMVSKLLPKIYGDTSRIDTLQDENAGLKEEMAKLRAEMDAKNKKEF
jgi:hypothetical protein